MKHPLNPTKEQAIELAQYYAKSHNVPFQVYTTCSGFDCAQDAMEINSEFCEKILTINP